MAYLPPDRPAREGVRRFYGELADQAAKAAFVSSNFQRDRAKLAAMGIAIDPAN